MRLDRYLVERGLASGREAAKRLIDAGAVVIDGKAITKPSFDVSDHFDVQITAKPPKYVGRGGEKL